MKILISELDELDKKIKDHFPRKIVRKSYAISIPELRRFPNYVSEFLINKYSEDDGTLREDALNEIINIMKKKAPEKKQKEALKSMAIELGAVEIIDHFQVYADLRRGKYYTRVSILDENAVVNRDLISPLKYQSLLKGGLWGKAKFLHIGQGESASLNMNEFESYQAEGVVLSRYINNRKNFSTNEWIDFLIRSNGLNPDKLIHKEKLLYLARLIPLVEACTNSLELGPPGTGKSFVFENASEYCRMLLSGEVSLPNLIYNKNTKQIGLVFKKDVLCFDEINKDNSKLNKLIPKLQQIMASNRVERGELEAMTDVSLVFQGNIDFTLKDGKRVPKEPNYLKILAKDMYDAAFLDRIHIFINGWEIPRINNEHINHKLGLISNYFSELLHKLRKEDCSYLIETNIEFFKLDLENKKRPISIRDKIALIHIISGFIKLIYPNKEISNEEWKQLADLAIILRQNVINEIIKIDPTLYRKIGYEIRHKKDEGAISETIPEKIEEELEDKGVLSTLEEYQIELNLIKINKKNYITDKIPFWLLTSLVDKNNIKIQENFYKLINLNDDLVQVSHLETDPIKNKKELGEQALVYAKEEDNLDRIEKKVNQLLKIVNDQKVFRNKLKLLEYQSTKLKHAEDIDKLIIQMETNKQKIPPLSSTLIRIIEKKILDIIESIQKSRGLTPDLISYNYVPLLLDHENIFKHLENKIKNWTKCNKLSLELFKDIFNKLLHIIRIKNEEKKKSQLIFEGQKFPLFAIDVNNLMYSLRDKFPDKYKNKTIKYPLYLINELYLEKTPYLAYFFVSNHLKKYLNDVPKNEYNKHYVETLRKNYSSGEYVDVDVMLASKITSVLDKYNNQINHFYLGSGDKDFHPIIKKAQKYKIPVSIIVSDGSSISNEISQLVNYQVDILY